MQKARFIFLALVVALPGSVPAEAETVTISIEECRKLVRHQPSADVAYQPGVDVHGRPVAPADLGSGANVAIPEEVEILVEVELDETHGAAASGLYQPKAEFGKVVFRDGRAWYNGQPLATGADNAVVAACKRRLHSRR